jgi:hypothetical protein
VGELQAQQHRLQLLAGKLERIRVLAIGQRSGPATHGIELHDTADSVLSQYRISLKEGPRPIVFIGREVTRVRATEAPRYLGFFSYDSETVAEIADDIELLIRKLTSRMATFEKLALLHQTTQRVTRELESYSRRMDIAIRRARRHPELLTPARFERIVAQAIAKMEELKEIPRRALRSLEKPRR